VSWESTLTSTSACGLTFSRLSLVALPSYVNCAASDDQFQRLFSDSGCRPWPCAVEDCGNATLAGLPVNLLNGLQSVLNAAARSIAGLRRSAHITDTLASFHWLRAPERINFKLAVIVYRALHGTAPRYLSDRLNRVADMPSRSRLRSSTFNQLTVRPSRLVTVGERSFASAAQSCGTVFRMTVHLLHH